MSSRIFTLGSVAAQTLIQEARRFLSWWVGELKSSIPDTWSDLLNSQVRHLRIRVDSSGISGAQVLNNGASGDAVTKRVQEETPLDIGVLESAHFSGLDIQVVPEVAIRRRFILPAAASENLRQALEFEMDRLTPFFSHQVYFDYKVVRQDEEVVEIDLIAVPKANLEAAIQLAEELQIPVVSCHVIDPDSPAILNLSRYLPQSKNIRTRRKKAYGIILATLILGIFAWPMIFRYQQWLEWNEILNQVQSEAVELRQLADRIENLNTEHSRIHALREQYPSLAVLFADLSNRLPDSIWLTELRYDAKGGEYAGNEPANPTLVIRGHADSTREIVTSLEASELYQDLTFESSVREHKSDGTETFVLRMNTVRTPGDQATAEFPELVRAVR